MSRPWLLAALFLSADLARAAAPPRPPLVSDDLAPTYQRLRPAGEALTFAGRPVDMVLSPDGRFLHVKDNRGIVVLDRRAWKVVQELRFAGAGGSMFGIALSRDGRRLYAGTATDHVAEGKVGDDGRVAWTRKLVVPGPGGKGNSFPCGLALSADEATLHVCLSRNNALGTIDLKSGKLTRQIPVSIAPYAVVLAPDGKSAYVSNWGGRHPVKGERSAPSSGTPVLVDERGVARAGTVGKVDLAAGKQTIEVATGLHPSALLLRGDRLYVANANSDTVTVLDAATMKEVESISVRPDASLPFGSAPNALALSPDGRTLYVANGGNNAIAVVALGRAGERSRVLGFIPTAWYHQVFGDMGIGRGEPKLCLFPERLTPNHHALAREFVLLDNFYCNGVLSADGHSWATEGHVTSYLERSFGGFTRSYTFGDDPLTYSSTGFVWDQVLLHGLSFRNYGEFDDAQVVPARASFREIWDDYAGKKGRIRFTQKVGIEPLRRYTCPDYPGWNMKIPDVLRADVFLRELADFDKKGTWPNFVIVYLPQDHCSGIQPGMPTPAAHMADNDLALGRVVEGISRSRFWPRTCIFVIEDDPQNGFDHVDGHRSPCLVISPYTRRGAVVSAFYNQTSVLHTMLRILGCPPMNQTVSLSPLMTECFTGRQDLTPYRARPVNVPLDQLNWEKGKLKGRALFWAERSLALDLSKPDLIEEDAMNRVLWFAMRGRDDTYPASYVGAHGRGLPLLRLRHEAGLRKRGAFRRRAVRPRTRPA